MREHALNEYDWIRWQNLNWTPADGDKDTYLIREATKQNRLVITADFETITPQKFKPCSHSGILVFPEEAREKPEYMFERLQCLRAMQLAHRLEHSFTYVNDDGVRIHTHNEIIERKYDDRCAGSKTIFGDGKEASKGSKNRDRSKARRGKKAQRGR